MLSALAQLSPAQTTTGPSPEGAESPVTAPAAVPESPAESYAVFNATPAQETALRAQIRVMQPDELLSSKRAK